MVRMLTKVPMERAAFFSELLRAVWYFLESTDVDVIFRLKSFFFPSVTPSILVSSDP